MQFVRLRLDADLLQNSNGKETRKKETPLKTLRTSLRTLLKTLLRTYKYDAYALPGMKAFGGL